MELKTANTREFLPEFSLPSAFLCDALSGMLKYSDGRLDCLPAPMTLESCLALTDDEMQAFYNQFGLAKYYPDISHYRRAWLLFMQNRLWRLLGTPTAIEVLCTYLFDEVDVSLDIQDNLAFDADGNLIDEELLDTFDAELTVSKPYLPDNMFLRVLANIIKFTRNQEWLRNFTFLFEVFEKTVSVAVSDGDAYAVEYGIGMNVDARAFQSNQNVQTGTGSASFSRDYSIDITVNASSGM